MNSPNDDDFERFVQNLAQLSPTSPVRSRNQLLFEAGRASTRVPSLWVWQTAAVGFAAVSLGLGLALLWPSSPQVIERERERVVIQYRDREPSPMLESETHPAPSSGLTSADIAASLSTTVQAYDSDSDPGKMLRRRNEVLRFGVEMLPRADVPGEAATSSPTTEPTESLYLPNGAFAVPPLKRRPPRDDD